MTSPYSPILPLTSPTTGSYERPAKRKRENTRQACQRCRESKSKCDSGRPICGPCVEKGRNCEYEFAQPGVPRQSAMKARLDSLEALFKQLKQATAPKAQRLFNRLRSNAEIQWLLQDLDAETGADEDADGKDPSASVIEQRKILSDLAEQSSGSDETPPSLQRPDQPQPVALHDGGTVTEPTEILSFSIEIPSEAVTRAAVENFFTCAGTLLHVFSRDQAKVFHGEVFSRGPRDASWKASVCCICALAAIGKAYDHTPDASASSKRYYETAKRLFEDLIEVRSLDGIKVCTLLALYNIFDKATLAIIHVEVGMSLAKYFGLESNRQLVQLPKEKWIDYRKSWRTLLFFKSWLCFTLGYMAGDDILAGNTLGLDDLDVSGSHDIEDMIQTETAKVSFLKAKILRIDLMLSTVAARTVQTISSELENWLQNLPSPMRLEALRDGQPISDDHRRSIYYLHLLYQGARMLLYRRILSQQSQADIKGTVGTSTASDVAVMLQALDDGRKVADMTSHTLRILQAENGIFKRCWLVIFQAFTAGTLILFEAAQKQAHGMREKEWRQDLDMVQAPLSTLAFCATLDPVAHKFHGALLPYYDKLVRVRPSSVSEHSSTGPSSHRSLQYLCQVPQGRSENINRAQELRQMLCVPFGEPRQKVNHLEIEHLDWHLGSIIPFHWEQNFEKVTGQAAEAVDLSQQSNAFAGESQHPSGWQSPPPGSMVVK